MATWEERTYQLPESHGWRAKAGYKIFVADRGAVRFDVPDTWLVEPGPGSVKFHDQEPPDDQCALEVSFWRLPPGIDWSELLLDKMLLDALGEPDDNELGRTEPNHQLRHGIERVWLETCFVDKREKREAYSRVCVARGFDVQTLITLTFWAEDYDRLNRVWREILRTLQLGQYIEDPLQYRLH